MLAHSWIYPPWDRLKRWAFCRYCGLGKTLLVNMNGCRGTRRGYWRNRR